jgi:hypothetical protein
MRAIANNQFRSTYQANLHSPREKKNNGIDRAISGNDITLDLHLTHLSNPSRDGEECCDPCQAPWRKLVTRSAGSVGAVLKNNGHNTSWFGKMHNVTDWMSSQAGPVRSVADRAGL